LRGLISDITDLEAYINTRGFLRYLADKKECARGDTMSLGLDLRPSTPRIARAVAQAMHDEGILVENVGRLPSPALMSYALGKGRASVMVTGSHIPFDRNGIKFNMKSGEVLKEDEPGILGRVQEVRAEEYNRPAGESYFDDKGFFQPGRAQELPPETSAALKAEFGQRGITFLGDMRPERVEPDRIIYQDGTELPFDLLLGVPKHRAPEVVIDSGITEDEYVPGSYCDMVMQNAE